MKDSLVVSDCNMIQSATDKNDAFSRNNDSILFEFGEVNINNQNIDDLSEDDRRSAKESLKKAKLTILENDNGEKVFLAGNIDAVNYVLRFYNQKPIYNEESKISGKISTTTIGKVSSQKSRDKSNKNGFDDYCHLTAGANLELLFRKSKLQRTRPDINNDPMVERIDIFSVPVDFADGIFANVQILAKRVDSVDGLYTIELKELDKVSNKNGWDESEIIRLAPLSSSKVLATTRKVTPKDSLVNTLFKLG